MEKKPFLTFEKQLELFEKRGIKVKDKEIAIQKISNINYYKIKEFAKPFEKKTKDGIMYENISFEGLIKMFYADKYLRLYLLEAIEKVEISIKTRIGYTLGKHHGAEGYKKFNNWCNKEKYCRDYINDQETNYEKRIHNYIQSRSTLAINDFRRNEENIGKSIPIWMVTEVLTFGDTVKIYELMSKKLRKEISRYYGLDANTFEKYLKHLNLIRNFSAHNSKIIDIALRTLPPINSKWKKFMCKKPNGLAITTFILKDLIAKINPKYGFGNLHKTLSKYIQHKNAKAKALGFKDYKAIGYLYKK